MTPANEYASLSDEELRARYKKAKQGEWTNALLSGIFIGVSVYSCVKNGISFFALAPLVFVYLLAKNRSDKKQLEHELRSRGL